MTEQHHTRISVLISGSGSNLQALIDATKDGRLPNCSIVRVISDKKAAFGLERAKQAGIPTHYHGFPPYKEKFPQLPRQEQRREFDRDLSKLILGDNPDIVVCAGYMLILTEPLLQALVDAKVPIINLHPALPGEYNGTHAIDRAHADWKAGKITRTGVMIHYVILEVDMGTPILTKEIPFVDGEDDELEIFEEKLHKVEWGAIVEGTRTAIERLWSEKSK
ncbi:Bifunctional purine biosynthetic protein ADE5,7 [Diplodia seriata]|uniref:Phosphoribosylglycinamide formyltransferase n=1 Tax=Diplodia seriata TaxID=420778 RepID=A0A0G2EHU2_9PEZI|nr:putative phosphoribosylglycinamide formyltransferase [Diplodia seriata]OMP84581.1 Phosphoribosylglycinamide formyltransferase [Diplodia seriata]